MKRLAHRLPLLLSLAFSACPQTPTPPRPDDPDAAPPPPPAPAVWVEQIDDVGVLQLGLEGWDRLSADQRRLAYHLALAAIAGDPITYDQRYDRNLELKRLLEGIARRGDALDPDLRERLLGFLKRFWIHHGLHDSATGQKLEPGFSFEELWAGALGAFHAGERFGLLDESELRAWLDDLAPALFDPAVDARWGPDELPEGEDAVGAGLSNFYEDGLAGSDLEGFRSRHPRNSRLTRDAEGNLLEEVYRTGTDEVPSGLYAPQLRRVVGHLRDALPFADETQRAALETLIESFETGDPAALRRFDEAWAAGSWAVDGVLGFVETDEDPRGEKGTWEGLVLVRDETVSASWRTLAGLLPALEADAPWEAAARRDWSGVPEPAALAPAVVRLAIATGQAALLSPAGLDLPNDPAVRRDTGNRRFALPSLDGRVREAVLERAVREFAADDTEASEARRCASAWDTFLALHEVAGHALGRRADEEDGAGGLGEYAAAIEEAQADLTALHFADDARLAEAGLLPAPACAEALARDYVRGTLLMLRGEPDDEPEDPALRAHLLVVRYAMEREAVVAEPRGTRTDLRLPAPTRWREVADELLAAVSRVRAEGDFDGARALVETYGAKIPEGWRDEAQRRAEYAGIPARFAFLPPLLEPVRDPAGAMVDVRAVEAPDLVSLLLAWSAVAGAE